MPFTSLLAAKNRHLQRLYANLISLSTKNPRARHPEAGIFDYLP